ncbi:helix-turn-helix transcriptional regulator [Streptomyces sp. B1866]|uniref:helix-turn-helix domain-containing protein n=1 Tax=Streptomyces sp. B1866 TaxID=3075431 RepID=UPI0028927692|nr:helix-turn-helix transcriptional regulator [Streptomyces sp. B1866]MDT3397467.1 helix-turn-helix transcriptional regulator [Streptomyces sp. B1866]
MTEREDCARQTSIQRVLAKEVGRWRSRQGLSIRELAEKAHFKHSYVGRVERGEQMPSEKLAECLDVALETGGTFSDILDAALAGTIQEYSRKSAAQEAKAERIQVARSSTVPALLQTPDYARALYRVDDPKAPTEEVERDVADRMDRKKVLEREDPPLYWAIMDEAVLKRPIGGTSTMLGQLSHILKASENRRITIQIVPFESGEYAMMGGSLTLLTSPSGLTVAYVESFGSGELVESAKRVVQLTHRFDSVRRLALSEPESLEMVKKYLEAYRGKESQAQ